VEHVDIGGVDRHALLPRNADILLLQMPIFKRKSVAVDRLAKRNLNGSKPQPLCCAERLGLARQLEHSIHSANLQLRI
jgi:hypothetical protein